MTQSPRPAYVSSLLLLVPILLLPYFVIFLIAFFFFLFLCFRNQPSPAHNVANFFHNFHIGGHRGSPQNAPENTMVSFQKALSEGVDLVEFDIGLTRDGVPVLMHDHTLDRTTNMSGLLREYLLQELKIECDCGAKFGNPADAVQQQHQQNEQQQQQQPNGCFVPICVLEEVVKWATENNVKMLFDVKDSNIELANKIEELFERHDLFDRAIVCSFFPLVIYWIKRKNSRIMTGLSFRRRLISYLDLQLTIPRFSSPILHYSAIALDALHKWSVKVCLPHFLGADMVLVERGELCENFVTEMAGQGFRICAWTVNDQHEMVWVARKLGVPFLTDVPGIARRLLDNAPPSLPANGEVRVPAADGNDFELN